MKKYSLINLLILFLVIFSMQAESILPITVNQFLQERQLDAPRQKGSRIAPPYVKNGQEMIDAFIDIESREVITTLKAQGVIINCEFDGFITAQIPVNRLEKVCHLSGVIDVELSKMLDLCTDTTLRVTHAGQVIDGGNYDLPKGYDGTGVIVGIIDSGFDYQHLAFRKADDHSQTRISRVYSYTNTTGHPVIIGTNTLPGSVFMNEQIDTMTTDIQSIYDINTHGTHTASIAAGMHVNGYGGMAPGAEIVLCSSRSMTMTLSSTEIVNFIKYLYTYADSVGKPCVVSLSVSTRDGAHDGNDKISKAIAQNTGPGHIFVVAAGNNGKTDLYAHGPATPEKPYSFLIGNHDDNADDSYSYDYTWIDTWVRSRGDHPVFQYHILDKETGKIVWKSDFFSSSKTIYSSDFSDYFEPLNPTAAGFIDGNIILNTYHRKFEVTSKINNLKCKSYYYHESGKTISRYQFGVSIFPPSVLYSNQADSCYLDSWVSTSSGCITPFNQTVYIDRITADGDTIAEAIDNYYATPSNECSINSIAANDSVISVGGYVARAGYRCMTGSPNVTPPEWLNNYAYFTSFQRSGCGPTGEALPTITAPAYNVVAAYNHYASKVHEASPTVVMKEGDDFWGAMSGTSMAAPAVAGIIAQWLQINPNLGPKEIKDIIAQSAIKDNFTLSPESGFHFGPNGKIDAMAGARLILSQMPEEVLLGDVNNDGILSIRDVSALIDHMLGMTSEDVVINIDAADLNQDGRISISDVSALIDLLLE